MEGEFGEGRGEPMPQVSIQAEFVVVPADVSDERVYSADYSRRAKPCEPAHRPQPGLEPSVTVDSGGRIAAPPPPQNRAGGSHRHDDDTDELTGPALDIITADGANHALHRRPHRRLTPHMHSHAAERHLSEAEAASTRLATDVVAGWLF